MIYENHDFDNDPSYHDMLVGFHMADLDAEFAALQQQLSAQGGTNGGQ